ncbi:MAG TPA: adenylate/guanylate cyclase domain-containing protein [bacterium]|jgi:class 3 adenylate cyclase|nr:adenylate/guanylate cyclase domain-containing protein [bacterium]
MSTLVPPTNRIPDRIARLAAVGVLPSDGDDTRLLKGTLTVAAAMFVLVGFIWAGMYALLGLYTAAAVPFTYSVISLAVVIQFVFTKRYAIFRFSQLFLLLLLPFILQWSLGGLVNSGAVMLWSFMAPVGALLFVGTRNAVAWLVGFLALSALSGLLDGRIAREAGTITAGIRTLFFVLNITGVCTIVYLLTRYFTRERELAQERSERLLLNVLPPPIAQRLKHNPSSIADAFADVTVLFADVVDFTKFSAGIAPQQLVALLNDIFTEFDALAERYGLEKIKTVGDAYMVVGGLPTPRADHVEAVAEMALQMAPAMERCSSRAGAPLQLRIGIHTGPVVAGVIGRKKFIYDLWGDTVNTASRMESHGLPGRIQVTEDVYIRLKDRYAFEARGSIEVKSKGRMPVYLLLGRAAPAADSGRRAAVVAQPVDPEPA